ncbi:MAG TPA: AAA family ATPase [Terriglobia bacterium]|nr:AAA family ATPase [Terriglobia bacterium]
MSPAEERVIRVLRPSVIVLCGPAACGKSTFAARHFRRTHVISSDLCRQLVCDDETDQRYHAQTFALLNFLIGQRLSINRICVVDSTAITTGARKSLLDLGRKYRVPTELFLFDIALDKCLERDSTRTRSVGPKVIEEQYQLFRQAQQSVRSEGFDRIVELRDEDLESVRCEMLYRPINPINPNNTMRHRQNSEVSAKAPEPRS